MKIHPTGSFEAKNTRKHCDGKNVFLEVNHYENKYLKIISFLTPVQTCTPLKL